MYVNEARRVCLLILWLISSTQLPQDREGDTEVLLWFHWRSKQNLLSLECIILSSTFLQQKNWRSFVHLRLGCLLETEASSDDRNSIVLLHTLYLPGFIRSSRYRRRPEFSIDFPVAVISLLRILSVAKPTSYAQPVDLSVMTASCVQETRILNECSRKTLWFIKRSS